MDKKKHYKIQIDSLDKRILNILIKNARTPFLEIARECGVSGAAIHQRIKRLEMHGVITGSKFIVDPLKLGLSTCAYMGIFLEKASMYESVVKQIEKIPEIVECNYTTG
ncbi:MAG: Lrp/AsnC family transcriptional regulator, partial [Chlorobi bacterium]|nr:Lrp/AsnC family transcriptional regulator [Chlorobiota bacterium]